MSLAARARTDATQERKFGMHPALLLDVIQRQAGTLAKAVLEGVMNSIDARCRRCDITLAEREVVIADDGQGITQLDYIEKFFETFGQPHEAHERKVYGTFRMGRGQLFAYGKNSWRTGPFLMDVDFKHRGCDYTLRTGLKPVKGCRIQLELYKPLLPSELAETQRLLRRWVCYAPARITLNGRVITTDPAAEAWTHVTPEAYIRLDSNLHTLAVYNLGVHTVDLGSYRLGTGGLIVSRRQLEVNFARNDIQDSCPVWQKIKPLVDQKARRKLQTKTSLNDAERQRLADLIVQGEPPPNVATLRLFTAVNGRHYSLQQILNDAWRHHQQLTFCPRGHRVGDKVFQHRLAFVLAQETLTRFACDEPALLALLWRHRAGYRRHDKTCPYRLVPFLTVAADIDHRYDLLDAKDLTANERLWQVVAEHGYSVLRGSDKSRKILLGRSEAADAWTDGRTYIVLGRKFLKTRTFDVAGVAAVAEVLLHECCHDGPDTAEHTHTQEFFEEYHNRSLSSLPQAIDAMLRMVPRVFAHAQRQLPRDCLKHPDRTAVAIHYLEQTLEALRKLPPDPDEEP